ncbi:transcriptional regulator [Streptomyces sp. NPDC005969]|uniref:transcriptional regulator n=1 Tax=Streptomyces sp. NPDC005969 TaxID=3156722 RepID=UPI0033D941CD
MTIPAQVGPSPVGGGPAVHMDREEFLADIGDRIRAERRARGWTQTQLGQRSGLSRKVIEYMEYGKTTLPLLGLADVCAGLGMTLSALLSEEWVMPAPAHRERALTPRQAQILRAAAAGGTLLQVAARVGTSREVVAARLSEAYRVLGVSDRPRNERRAAAVQVAEARGLFDDTREVNAA